MSYDAVFVDLDDTLYPYDPCNEAGRTAARRRLAELGYETEDGFGALYRAARRDVKRELPGRAAGHERYLYFKRALERLVGASRPADARALGDAYWEAYLDEMAPFEGVEATLERLREAGLAVVVVTNLTTRIQLEKLERLGLDGAIDLLVTSEEVGTEKPAGVVFTTPLARLDLRPSEALMVGNSVAADIEGGNAAGLTTALFNAEAPETTGPRRPDHRLDGFADLLDIAL